MNRVSVYLYISIEPHDLDPRGSRRKGNLLTLAIDDDQAVVGLLGVFADPFSIGLASNHRPQSRGKTSGTTRRHAQPTSIVTPRLSVSTTICEPVKPIGSGVAVALWVFIIRSRGMNHWPPVRQGK